MPAHQRVWTAEMVRALPDDGYRYEVLDGALFVSPAPTALHQRAVFLLCAILHPYAKTHGIGEAMISHADIEFSQHRVLQPDVFVVPLNDGRLIRSWREVRSLLLSAEVILPSTERADRGEKRLILQDEEVPEYWIVDLDTRSFERWRPDDEHPEVLSDTLVWRPISTVPALEIDLVDFFDSVFG